MQKIILDNREAGQILYPFTATRHAADIRVGILTIREKFLFKGNCEVFDSNEHYFEKYPGIKEYPIVLQSNIVPTETWLDTILNDTGKPGYGGIMLENNDLMKILNQPWEIFKYNDWALREDFKLITEGRQSQPISSTNKIINSAQIFLEEGATVEHCILNASLGPIYIGKNAELMEGCMIRGSFAMCEGSLAKMGSKFYGATTIGPYCLVGGEIKNSILMAYSNKAHDGYLGDSVIGEWCNLGAGTSNSNIKNNCGDIYYSLDGNESDISAGNKGGLLMGDYSKAAINTSFNTGTIVGVCCNVFTNGLTPKYIPDFSWGSDATIKYKLVNAIADIDKWKQLKGFSITERETKILTDIYKKN